MKKSNFSVVISFMGPDGSGKSTLIKRLSNRLKKNYVNIKYLHLRPYLFLLDKSTVNRSPHNQKPPLLQFQSFIKILLWLFIYQFFFLIKCKKKNQLVFFDRYAHDLLIDPKRYRFNLSKKITKFILDLFPKPNLWIILKAPIKLLEKRKKELPTKELKRQMIMYEKFAKKTPNSVVINTNLSIKNSLLLISKKIKSIKEV